MRYHDPRARVRTQGVCTSRVVLLCDYSFDATDTINIHPVYSFSGFFVLFFYNIRFVSQNHPSAFIK